MLFGSLGESRFETFIYNNMGAFLASTDTPPRGEVGRDVAIPLPSGELDLLAWELEPVGGVQHVYHIEAEQPYLGEAHVNKLVLRYCSEEAFGAVAGLIGWPPPGVERLVIAIGTAPLLDDRAYRAAERLLAAGAIGGGCHKLILHACPTYLGQRYEQRWPEGGPGQSPLVLADPGLLGVKTGRIAPTPIFNPRTAREEKADRLKREKEEKKQEEKAKRQEEKAARKRTKQDPLPGMG